MRTVNYLNDLITFPSISSESNLGITDQLESWLKETGFDTERVDYRDQHGVAKSCLASRKGPVGPCGFAYFCHTDVVPVNSWNFPQSDPWTPFQTEDRVYGRGSCDMKGSLACMLGAACATVDSVLRAPVFIMATADEEIGMRGAMELAGRSTIYREIADSQSRAVIGEPTSLEVVHAHKGGRAIRVSSLGRAAHSSTGLGINANLAMIPFLSELKAVYDDMETNPAWQDNRFTPPTATMNIGVNDHNEAVNITAARSDCVIYFRPMPGQNADDAVDRIRLLAEKHGLLFELLFRGAPLFTDPSSDYVRELLALTGNSQSRTVAYGTDGAVFTDLRNIVVLGPGSIDQAHTDDEWISLEQLQKGTALFEQLIRHWCVQ